MTESEALTRWCPFARTIAPTMVGPMTVNRDPRPEVQQACLCIASACMAWQGTVKEGYCGLATR